MAQCGDLVFADDFSNPSPWQIQGNGAINVSNGSCNLVNAYGGSYNRTFRNIGTTVSNTYWKAECKLHLPGSNPPGFGSGAIVLALTADTLDFMTLDSSQGYAETNQDGIAVVLYSGSTSHNINSWFFMIEGKKGNVRTYDLNSIIYANSSISDYYIRLERTGAGATRLSVFSDAQFTVPLNGSPVSFSINPFISGLNVIQHGSFTPGSPTRLTNCSIDNDTICHAASTFNECIPLFSDNFSTPSNWNLQTNGAVSVNNGALNFVNVYAGVYNRAYQNVGNTLSDTYWRADCDIALQFTNPAGNGTGAIVMTLTADTLDFMAYDASQNYAATNQDGIAVTLTSLSTTDNNPNNWFFLIQAKKGSVRTYDVNTGIYVSSQLNNYYISLERTGKANVRLSIYQDSLRTIHQPGSPSNFTIDTTITGLRVIQHGSNTSGNPSRQFTAAIDNDFICTDVILSNTTQQTDATGFSSLLLYPNPSNGLIYINPELLSTPHSENSVYRVYDMNGKQLMAGLLSPAEPIDLSALPNAVYLIEAIIEEQHYFGKLILRKE
jgi:hypothetical protein